MADTMDNPKDDVTGRLDRLEQRIAAMERFLVQMTTPQAAHQSSRPAAVPPPLPAMPLRPLAPPPVIDVPDNIPFENPATYPVAPVRPAPPRRDLESIIGRNWTSWVGGIVVVLGVLFFLNFAWEQGWLAMSPMARVGLAVGAGVLLGLAGEFVHRRAMAVLAATLSGAGIAIVMAAFFAGPTLFADPLFSPRVALAGVCAAAAVGIWRALRFDAATLAVIALLGAYLAPLILRTQRDESVLLMAYLAALAVVGWALAYLRPHWPAVRWFTWACTLLWLGGWILFFPLRGEHRPLGMIAVTFFFAGFIAEAFFSLHRAFRALPTDQPRPAVPTALENTLATLSMLSTAAAFAGYFFLLDRDNSTAGIFRMHPATAVALGLASVHGVLSVATPSYLFGRSSILQAAALVTLAVPLAFGQVAITLGWLVLAVALAALGWGRDRRGAVQVWSVVLLVLAAVRLFAFDLFDPALRPVPFNVAGQDVSRWLLLACGTAVVAHVIAWLTAARPAGGAWIAASGTIVFYVAIAMSWRGVPLTDLALAAVAILLALAPRAQRLRYADQATAALLVIAIKWISLDGLNPVADAWAHPGSIPPIFNAVAAAGAILIVLTLFAARQVTADVRAAIPVAVAVLCFALANFETLRVVDYRAAAFADVGTAKMVALSVLWGLIGLAAVVVGFAKNQRPLRYAALGLLGITLLKVLFVDLAQVRPVYRILSFLAVGGLLLCVSFVYHRQEQAER